MTDWDGFQARVHPGDGIIARSAGGALVLPSYAPSQQATVDQLLDLIRDARPGGGRTLARRLAGILATSEGDESVHLALLAPLSGDDLAVLVVGDVEVRGDTADGPVNVSGRNSLTWVDQVLKAPSALEIHAGSGADAPLERSDLIAGIVPGSGLSLAPRGEGVSAPSMPVNGSKAASSAAAAPAPVSYEKAVSPPAPDPDPVPPSPDPLPPPPAPMPPSPSPAPPTPIDYQVESLSDAAPPARPPLPVGEPEPGSMSGSEPTMVKGVYCEHGHFNDPMLQFCAVCGANMAQQTPALVDGPRPPLGVLLFDDGSVFQLEQDYVIGRQPEGAPEVVSGSARPLRLEDSSGTVSRAHALVALEDWSVRLSDHGSSNGTYIAMPNSQDWQSVPPNGRIVLAPGTTIKLGNRSLRYESHHGQQ